MMSVRRKPQDHLMRGYSTCVSIKAGPLQDLKPASDFVLARSGSELTEVHALQIY